MTDWIKTSDEMPPPDRWVLGWFDGASRPWITCRRDGWFEVDGESDSDVRMPPPTHWQPLPPRPHRVERYALKTVESAFVLPEPIDTPTRIWSGEYMSWWRRVGDSKGGNGYTDDAREAGVWTFGEAYAATCHCGVEKRIVLEALVPA